MVYSRIAFAPRVILIRQRLIAHGKNRNAGLGAVSTSVRIAASPHFYRQVIFTNERLFRLRMVMTRDEIITCPRRFVTESQRVVLCFNFFVPILGQLNIVNVCRYIMSFCQDFTLRLTVHKPRAAGVPPGATLSR